MKFYSFLGSKNRAGAATNYQLFITSGAASVNRRIESSQN
jgi:hypothetical protein